MNDQFALHKISLRGRIADDISRSLTEDTSQQEMEKLIERYLRKNRKDIHCVNQDGMYIYMLKSDIENNCMYE
jgi:hypothetical protein